MRVIGMTNKLGYNLRLFMWEYDNVSEYDAYEEASFLCQVFNIDIDVLESSPQHYHLISFDILSLKTVSRIQHWVMHEGDYLNVCEMPLFDDKGLWNTLRVGNKFAKPNPHFLKRFINPQNTCSKSIRHLRFYQFFCKTPNFPIRFKNMFVDLEMMLSVYTTGTYKRKLKRSKPYKPKKVKDRMVF